MDADQYRVMAELQSHHWWFEAKRRVVRGVARRVSQSSPPDPAARVLEVGCGTGSMFPVMREMGRLVGLDAYLPALGHVRRAGVDAVGGDLLALPFADAQFAVVGCFDVLYHRRVADLARALDELYRVCRPGGLVLITDSASPRLSSRHDVAMHGARRFRLADLRGRVQSAGFDVRHESYYHTLLFPVAAGIRLMKRAIWGAPRADAQPRGRSDLSPAPAWLNASLNRLYGVEARLVERHRLPFGLSLIIAAERPSTSASESGR